MGEALLRIGTVIERTGLSRSGVYAGMMAGSFPRSLKRGSTPLWIESEVQAWIEQQIATLPRTERKMGRSMGRARKRA
jgi:prophage regulatory protein